jgi:hypothetical protein
MTDNSTLKTEDVNFALNAYMLPNITNNIVLKSSFDIKMSKYTAQPLFSLGFNYYIHQSYELFDKELQKQGSKTFFWVVNGYELVLNDQDKKNELLNSIKVYLNVDVKEPIFLHIWEMLTVFDICSKNNKINIVSTLKEPIESSITNFSKKISKSTVEFVNKSYDVGILTFETYKTLLDQESNNFIDLFVGIVNMLDNLKDGGNLIVKLNDTFTIPSIKLIMLCRSLFDNLYIYKPYYSREVLSEKYLVCVNFRTKSYNEISKKLEKCISLINKNKDNYVTDFMSDIDILPEMYVAFTYINMTIANNQHRAKNKIMKYINSENYFGQEYQDYAARQISCTEYFVSHFFPINSNDHSEIKKKFNQNIISNVEKIKKFQQLKYKQ